MKRPFGKTLRFINKSRKNDPVAVLPEHIENAFKLLPGQIAALPRADKKSFLTPDLEARIKTYFQQDYALYNTL